MSPRQIEKQQLSFPIQPFPNIQINSGSIDRTRLKSCWLEVKGTFETTQEDKMKTINWTCKNISRALLESMNKDIFFDKFICAKEISDSFSYTGRSYTKIEYTLFLKKPMEKQELTYELNILSKKIWEKSIQDTESIKFHKTIISKRKYK